ncbi:MAG TPA: AraC family transcriptional regulator [Chloroflexota bacterium]
MAQQAPESTFPDVTFGINQDLPSLDSGWRTFPGHYLLYASSGAFTLDVADKQWTLPPQRAAWVAADVLIRIQAKGPITSSSILFARDSIMPPPFDCRVFAITPLAREMILHAMRWGIARDPSDVMADRFFAAVADVCSDLATHAERFWLPRVRSDVLTNAMDYILNHLESQIRIEAISRSVNVSQRTLARRFVEEAHLTCGEFIRRARMVRAMDLLTQPGVSITEVAYAAGFESISAFNSGFRRFTQETPTQYRNRFLPR